MSNQATVPGEETLAEQTERLASRAKARGPSLDMEHEELPNEPQENQSGERPDPKQARKAFKSEIPYEDKPADCVVICCSDPRFERQTEDFLDALGFEQPHYIQIPAGVAALAPLAASVGFIQKAIHRMLQKAIDHTGVKTVVCVGHHDCGGYKVGQVDLINTALRRFRGKDVRDIQQEHLSRAGNQLSKALSSDTEVLCFYADVTGKDGDQQVAFTPVEVSGRRRTRRSEVA